MAKAPGLLKRAPATRAKPKVGRPKATASEIAQNREMVLAGAERVFARLSYADISVEHILAEVGISRPTFYRWFGNKDEVLQEIVQRANTRLLSRIQTAVRGVKSWPVAIHRGTDAYLQWTRETGPLVVALNRDASLPGSPVERDRRRLSDGLFAIYTAQAKAAGQPPVHPLVYLSIFSAIERSSSWLCSKANPSDRDRDVARAVMVRAALAMLVHSSDEVPPLPRP